MWQLYKENLKKECHKNAGKKIIRVNSGHLDSWVIPTLLRFLSAICDEANEKFYNKFRKSDTHGLIIN